MSDSNFRFSPNILRRLGEELNPNPEQGLLELVKNSHDADASFCRLKFEESEDGDHKIIIQDDGIGMTATDIKNDFLVIGKSSKSKKTRTTKRRVPIGSKGLGRLAALRLGSSCSIVTVKKGAHKREHLLNVDWKNFENVRTVEEVDLPISTKSSSKNKPNGTHIEIENIPAPMSERSMERLIRQLLLLTDPFQSKKGFRVELDSPAFKGLQKLLNQRYFENADFHLIADLDAKGVGKVRAEDWRGNILYEAGHNVLAANRKRKGKKYSCPPLKLDIWIFLLSTSTFEHKAVTIKEVRDWLSSVGGVHVYEDGARVAPYGDPGSDWLDMNLRRASSPEERPSTNTTIGRLRIKNTNGVLVQKTDRSGYIESDEFEEVKDFCKDALNWLANRRLEQAEIQRSKKRGSSISTRAKQREQLEEVIRTSDGQSKEKISIALKSYQRSVDAEIDILKKEVQLYRTLSTAGITAATFAHESAGSPLKVIGLAKQTLSRRIRKDVSEEAYESNYEGAIGRIESSLAGIAALGSFTLSLLDQGKRRLGRVNINDVVLQIVEVFTPFLESRQVVVELELSGGKPYLNGSAAAVESIFANLINNSFSAFEKSPTKSRTIKVTSVVDGNELHIVFSDNGEGIAEIALKDIWLPGRSTKDNGTGLGLTIVRDTINDLNGEISVENNGVLSGANFSMTLPILGA
ncbi:MAG: signal transduction histidine kinase [Candidatus Azotimanducaceae bacterium]|jgi:signal transduction histidine kinase